MFPFFTSWTMTQCCYIFCEVAFSVEKLDKTLWEILKVFHPWRSFPTCSPQTSAWIAALCWSVPTPLHVSIISVMVSCVSGMALLFAKVILQSKCGLLLHHLSVHCLHETIDEWSERFRETLFYCCVNTFWTSHPLLFEAWVGRSICGCACRENEGAMVEPAISGIADGLGVDI